MSASSYVRELPLDALLPQQTESVEATPKVIQATVPLVEPPKPIYPKLEVAATLPQISINGDMVKGDEFVAPKIEHERIYPAIQEATAPIIHGESELLNESQLLAYYSNEQLDFVDDFVDEFVSVSLNFYKWLYLNVFSANSILETHCTICWRNSKAPASKSNATKIPKKCWPRH
jgi:hypothetical protein